MGDTTFSGALNELNAGKKVQRKGWNGHGMYVVLQKAYPSGIPINENTATAIGEVVGTSKRFLPYLMLQTVDGAFVPWVASQTDLLANDWLVYEAL